MAKVDRTPKKIAGLKLPKAIRQAPAIKALPATPAGRKLLGDALMEGAAAAAAKVMEAHAAGKIAVAAKPVKAAAPKLKKPAALKPASARPTAPAKPAAAAPAKPAESAPAKPVIPAASSAPAASPPKTVVAPAAIAAAPPKPPAATPEPFKNDVPVTAKPPVQSLDKKDEVDAPPAKSDAAE
jgi:hypothetical protein